MDVIWAFRQAYDKARQIKNTQDQYCTKALAGEWKGLAPEFPEDLQWEALVDVLRGRVKDFSRKWFASSDEDLVLWDSHPLALGATPQQVWVDGIPQLSSPHVNHKPASSQASPQTPDFDKEASDAVKYDGLPPLEPKTSNDDVVVFTNVSRVLAINAEGIEDKFIAEGDLGVVLVRNGKLICSSIALYCGGDLLASGKAQIIDLAGGWISPGLTSFGSVLGLEEIEGEASTSDGYVLDPLLYKVPEIAGGDNSIIRAADGLQYTTRNALLAYRSGVTAAITAPKSAGFLAGLSVVFATSAKHQLDDGGLIQDVAAVHVFVHHGAPSVSTKIASLRNLLRGKAKGDLGFWFEKVGKGEVPLVIDVDNADIMASLLRLKGDIEEELDTSLKFVFSGASEAHLLANEISDAGVGVVVSPSRSYPGFWEKRRILPGPPLSQKSNLLELRAHNVSVALGVTGAWEARNTRFDLGWIALEAGNSMSKKEVLALASVNLQQLLGVRSFETDLVASKGGDLLDFDSKVVAVISPRRGVVDLF
ncbi:hypothetical protein PHLCEN_2v6486 [Hermanssonia centrifuga]|uniref:Uncharacterized protein n=1 Tax=Hermanssonia centrifuga TaxID=98765 RepID=A0A2R6NZA9_9APHY|nr:hypothetical protein PHLCEN_2v6486 [Hermanssonia centrifuga]